jgi:hypothetical protein
MATVTNFAPHTARAQFEERLGSLEADANSASGRSRVVSGEVYFPPVFYAFATRGRTGMSARPFGKIGSSVCAPSDLRAAAPLGRHPVFPGAAVHVGRAPERRVARSGRGRRPSDRAHNQPVRQVPDNHGMRRMRSQFFA